MKSKAVSICLIALWGVFPFVSVNTSWADEEALSNKRLASMFQKAERFEEQKVTLSADKAASIEKKIGAKLLDEDLNPIFTSRSTTKRSRWG